MHVLVCGGAGYVVAHGALTLAQQGHVVTVLDNLSNGQRAAVKWGPLLLVASSQRAREQLGWQPKRADLEGILRSAWAWRQAQVY